MNDETSAGPPGTTETRTLTLRNNTKRQRYEALDREEVVGYTEYNMLPDSVEFKHTEVLQEGKGVGSFLVDAALADAKAQGMHVVPMCPFVAAYLRKHHEYTDLVKPELRPEYKL